MKILVTGSAGMVGTAIAKVFNKHELILCDRVKMDITDFKNVLNFDIYKPELIIHCAAETDHERCEENQAHAYNVNVAGTANVLNLAMRCNSRLIYVGAGSIFDGKKNMPYTAQDKPNPNNHYNMSKWYGEMLVYGYKLGTIVRAGWMFGGGMDIDKKFVKKIMLKIKRGDKEIKVCDDCFGSPTYTIDFANAIREVTNNGYNKIYHAVNSGGPVSRLEYAQEIVKILNSDVKIIPCKIDDLKYEFPCPRTNYEVLDSDILMPNWKDSLRNYINDYFIN